MIRQTAFVMIAAILFTACKKDDLQPSNLNPTTPSIPVASTDKLKDSAVLYSKDIYLWYNQIPSSFDGNSFTDLDKIMTALRQYSTEPGHSQPVDRWSFAMKQTEWNNVSSGISGDFGLGVFFRSENDLRVKSVEASSPAGKAGIRRGWKITSLNGNTNIASSNTDLVVQAVYNSSSTSFGFQKPDGANVTISLTTAGYKENPIYLDSVYTVGTTKVGYLVFNSFLGDTTQIYNDFSRIFSRFASAGVTDVVVDLRYNGGGYVSVQERLANYLAPSSANGNLMMTQKYNDKYTRFNETVNFKKLGSFNPSRIFFIVSKSTASASELLINNLKPYVTTKLVGPNNTYGKPVGFFPIPLGDWYIFPVSFRSVNKNGEGNYFSGIAVDKQVADGLDKDWGDVAEANLSAVLGYIGSGSFSKAQRIDGNNATYIEPQAVKAGNAILDAPSFKGSIDSRPMR